MMLPPEYFANLLAFMVPKLILILLGIIIFICIFCCVVIIIAYISAIIADLIILCVKLIFNINIPNWYCITYVDSIAGKLNKIKPLCI